ncbi:MAG: hypothetical protein H7Y11_08120 [Armatimonadetes bacterium]|nr:hypothetical protein [Anaerolineae bacterium]
MSDTVFRVNTDETLVDMRLSKEEVKRSLEEVERIANLPYPFADATVAPIQLTHGEWYRQKLSEESWRTIIAISVTEKEIIVHAILLRDENTYALVRQLYETMTP